MTTFAIGDVQGCYSSLRRLLDSIGFDPAVDDLWFTGDLVNRGPDSLAVLRFLKDLDHCSTIVLGNHDLHLLAVYEGIRSAGKGDTLDDILNAPDVDELMLWLRQQPLLHHDTDRNLVLVHAGIPPQWDLIQAKKNAQALATQLRHEDYAETLRIIFGDKISAWSEELSSSQQLTFAANCLTSIRFCTSSGALDFSHKGAPVGTSELVPWFDYPNPAWYGARFVIGHWAALGLHLSSRVIALDSGCVWGNQLTAANLDMDFQFHSINCTD